jgi:hypothetical protein
MIVRPSSERRVRRHADRLLPALAAATILSALLTGCGDGAASTIETAESPETTVDEASEPAGDASPAPAAPTNGAEPAPIEDSEPPAAVSSIDDLQAAALTPADLPGPEAGFEWAVRRDAAVRRRSSRLFDPCQPTDYATDPQRTEVRVVDLRVQEPSGAAPETASVRQNLARYQSADVADEALNGFRRVATECATSTGPDGTQLTTEVLDDADGRLLLQTTPLIGLVTSYTIVEQRGDVVTVVSYSPGEVRDADDDARAVAAAVTAALDAATS